MFLLGRVVFTAHATARLEQRCAEFGLDSCEARKRVLETVDQGSISRTRKSRNKRIYCQYYDDNLSFFVVCNEGYGYVRVVTVIIKTGRE